MSTQVYSTSTTKPLQRISYKEKLKRTNEHRGREGEHGKSSTSGVKYSEWGAKNADYYISKSDFSLQSSRKQKLVRNYNIYNNIIPEQWFNYVTNPLNSTRDEHTNFPSKIRPYNLVRPNIDLYMGEFIERIFNYTVINLDLEAYDHYQENLKKQLHRNVFQRYMNALNELGEDTGVESKEVELPEELEAKFNAKYNDIKASKGQKKLYKVEREANVFKELKRQFFDYIIAGECHSYKEVVNGKIEYSRVNPIDIDYGIAPDKIYTEDADWIVYRKIVSVPDIVDKFYDELKEEHHEYLDKEVANVGFTTRGDFYNSLSGDLESRTENVELFHVVWKSQTKKGKYNYIDELGQPQSEEVSEEFKLSEEDKLAGHTVKWFWVGEYWETYSLDGKFYFRTQPTQLQRNALNNLSVCKNNFNGFKFSNVNSENISIVDLQVPYLIMFIIVNYYIERTIAKSKGKIVLMDINVIPDKEGWDEEKFFYYAEAMGFGFIDRSKIGVDKSFNQYSTFDLDLYKNIAQLIEIKESIVKDNDRLIGLNPQRKGQVSASAGKGTTEIAQGQSSLISELLFDDFDDYRRTEYAGLLDFCRLTNTEPERGLYVNDMLEQEIYNLEPGEIAGVHLGIYVSNSAKDIGYLAQYKQFAQAFAQNGSSPSTVLEIIRSENVAGLQTKLKNIEEIQQKTEAKLAESAEAAELAKLELGKEIKQFEHELGVDLQEKDHDRLDNRELIKGEVELSKEQGKEVVEDTIDNIETRAIKREELLSKGIKETDETNVKHRTLDVKEKEINTKAKTEKYKADNALKIAKENKNKHDTK